MTYEPKVGDTAWLVNSSSSLSLQDVTIGKNYTFFINGDGYLSFLDDCNDCRNASVFDWEPVAPAAQKEAPKSYEPKEGETAVLVWCKSLSPDEDVTLGKDYAIYARPEGLSFNDDAGDWRQIRHFGWAPVPEEEMKTVHVDAAVYIRHLFAVALRELVDSTHADADDAVRLVEDVKQALADAQDGLLKRREAAQSQARFEASMRQLNKGAIRE